MADFKKAMEFIKQWEQEYEPDTRQVGDVFVPILCSSCFSDQGLKLVSERLGIGMNAPCPNCGSVEGIKLDLLASKLVIQKFFNTGTMRRTTYGGAPALVSNSQHPTNIKLAPWSGRDLDLLSEKTGWGIFEYGPRMWMIGEVEPLKRLIAKDTRKQEIERIVSEYPIREIGPDDHFYRMRRNVQNAASVYEFDSPPAEVCGGGRLDSAGFPVLYGSQDMQVCIHECRTTVDDDTYVATLVPTKTLRLLNLTDVLAEHQSVTEFESLDVAVHMLFLAKNHSYEISREIALAAKEKGFDGIVFPSYFSLLRTGARAFDTILGMSVRRIAQMKGYASSQIISNVAIFGWPIKDVKLQVKSINKVIMQQAGYDLCYGPVGFESTWPDGDADPRSRRSKRAALFMQADKEMKSRK